MVEIQELEFGYSQENPVFRGFSLSIGRGEMCSVIGPSGCGKTTLLQLIAGLKRPWAGRVSIDGRPITAPRPRTGLVLQHHGLLPWATVRDNARLGLRIRRFYGADGKHVPADAIVDRTEMERRVDYWLNRLGIDALQRRFPSQLSIGQCQRTALARTLALNPDLLLMDEPFSSLDVAIRKDLQQLMIGLHRESGRTTLVVTHDIEEAVVMGQTIVALNRQPNSVPTVLANPLFGFGGTRPPAEFYVLCETLQNLVGKLS